MTEYKRFELNEDNIGKSYFASGKGGFVEIMITGSKQTVEDLKIQIIRDQEKAILFENLIQILKKELPIKDLEKWLLLSDPLTRRILAYLAKDE